MRTLLAVLGLLVCSAAANADVLFMKDGSRVDGKLTFCDEEICSIDKRRFPLSGIARIELRPVEPIPLGARDGGVVLTDGSVHAGAFTGLTLGIVEVGGKELERGDVALIILAPVPRADVIVEREGAPRTGKLSTCNAASCTFEDETVPLVRILWIGLAQEGQTQPDADPSAALVFVREGDPVAARLSGLDATTVRTTSGSFPREEVTWIQLAPQSADAPSGAQPGAERPPSGESPSATPPGTPPPPSPPPSSPPPGPPPGTPPQSPSQSPAGQGTPTRGGLWTGRMELRGWGTSDDGTYWDHRIHTDVRMREYVAPLTIFENRKFKTIGRLIRLEPEGSVVRVTSRCRSPYITCTGEGTTNVTIALDEPDRSHASVLYSKTAPGSMQEGHGFDMPVGASLYVLSISPYETYPLTSRSLEVSTSEAGYVTLAAGRHPLYEGAFFDPQVRYLENGMMRGTYTIPGSGAYPQLSLSWSVCREGSACPPPEPLPEGPPEDFDPCARSGQQAGLADACRNELDLLFDSLGPALDEYNERTKAAERNREAFQSAQESCEFYDRAKEVLEAILTGGAGPAARAAQSLLYLRDLIEKVQEGDLASMFLPDEAQKFLGYYNKAKAIWFELTADDLAKMNRDLGACSGKVPIDTYMKAKKFLEDLTAAKNIWDSRVAPGLNDLRTKGLECASRNHAAWRACLEDAECRGVPPECGPEPPLAGAYDN